MYKFRDLPFLIWRFIYFLYSLEFKAKLSEQLSEKVFGIIDIINRHEFVPRVPVKEEEDTVFDTSFSEIQPYLFRVRLSLIRVFILANCHFEDLINDYYLWWCGTNNILKLNKLAEYFFSVNLIHLSKSSFFFWSSWPYSTVLL